VELSIFSIFPLMLIIALGCYIQTNTGFAFALIVMSLGAATSALPLSELALVISFLSLVNSTTALKGAIKHVDARLMKWLFCGIIPGALIGVWWLSQLSDSSQNQLKVLLGGSILISALLLMRKPAEQNQHASRKTIAMTGIFAGIMGGLFSTFGPPIAYLLYRQPIALKVVLNTLLATFWLTSVLRIGTVHVLSSVDTQVYWLALLGAPWIIVCTHLSKKFPPMMSERRLRNVALILLVFSGISILATGLIEL